MRTYLTTTTKKALIAFIMLTVTLSLSQAFEVASPSSLPSVPGVCSVLVQAADLETAAQLVRRAGGTVTHELGIIDAVGAELNAAQLKALRSFPGVERITPNRQVTQATEGGGGSGAHRPDTHYPTLVGADQLHAQGITGVGVTVAVVDTGFFFQKELYKNTRQVARPLAHYNAILDQDEVGDSDENGHASHLTGVVMSSGVGKESGKYQGVAPDADLVAVKAFNAEGRGQYSDVIRGLDWILTNKDTYGIRVANLSFSAAPLSFYWDDPLNQAVMALWQAGIVVVTSAGNTGPEAMTIGVPGNVPYVITVGAMTDSFTPADPMDDVLASFSAAGPTWEGFVKPEIVAPGGHLISIMPSSGTLATEHPEFWSEGNFFEMSGTSQATAVVSGVAALLLQAQPWLTPDEVKCRLMAEANPAVDAASQLAYSPFQQGAGLVDAVGAIDGTVLSCANLGLDIDQDLTGTEHYAGPARQDTNGEYHIGGGYRWDGSYLPSSGNPWTEGGSWTNGNPWTEGGTWIDGNPWTEGGSWIDGNPWTEGGTWIDGNPWTEGGSWIDGNPWTEGGSLTEIMAINLWVSPE